MFGSLGGPELILILVVALIVFGPRRLPEIGKSIGKMLVEFRRASTDFKRTIEEEVESEKRAAAPRLEAAAPASAPAQDPGQGPDRGTAVAGAPRDGGAGDEARADSTGGDARPAPAGGVAGPDVGAPAPDTR